MLLGDLLINSMMRRFCYSAPPKRPIFPPFKKAESGRRLSLRLEHFGVVDCSSKPERGGGWAFFSQASAEIVHGSPITFITRRAYHGPRERKWVRLDQSLHAPHHAVGRFHGNAAYTPSPMCCCTSRMTLMGKDGEASLTTRSAS